MQYRLQLWGEYISRLVIAIELKGTIQIGGVLYTKAARAGGYIASEEQVGGLPFAMLQELIDRMIVQKFELSEWFPLPFLDHSTDKGDLSWSSEICSVAASQRNALDQGELP